MHPETVVQITYTTGMDTIHVESKFVDWDDGVVAFRVIKEHKEPREFWLVCGDAYDSFEEARENKLKHDEIIHVREVTQ